MSSIVPFRLRIGKDDDLEAVFDVVPAHIEKSDIIREALRMYFFDAPTPLRDSMGVYMQSIGVNFEQTLSKPRVLSCEVKAMAEVNRTDKQVQPQLNKPEMDINVTVVNDKELESKLNKSLGF